LLLILSIVSLFTVQANVSAQTTTTNAMTVIVGQASPVPTIDGQWQQGEWDGATEYKLTVGSQSITNRPTMRLLHDNATLYVLVDVPSDNGSSYISSDLGRTWGWVWIQFGGLPGNHFCVFAIKANQNQQASFNVVEGWVKWSASGDGCGASYEDINSHTAEVTALTTTIHSNATHRIFEFSIPLYPYIVNTPLSQYNSWMGLLGGVFDSAGHSFALVSGGMMGDYLSMTFAATPVPEATNIVFLLPLTVCVSLVLLRRRKVLQ